MKNTKQIPEKITIEISHNAIADSASSSDGIFPTKVFVKSIDIDKINYNFDPESLKPFSSEIAERDPLLKEVEIFECDTPDASVLEDKQEYKKLVEKWRQLIEDHYVYIAMKSLSAKSMQIALETCALRVELERCALLIYLAKSWEYWGFEMHSMFKAINLVEADKKLQEIFSSKVTLYYCEARNNLIFMEQRFLEKNITDEDKKTWAKMLTYAQDKSISTLVLCSNDNQKINNAKACQRIGEKLLVKHGLGYLIPEYSPQESSGSLTENSTDSSVLTYFFSTVYSIAGFVGDIISGSDANTQKENEKKYGPKTNM